MKAGGKVSIYQKPVTGEDYEDEAVLSKPIDSEVMHFNDGNRLERWWVVFPVDGNAQTFGRNILVDAEGKPVFSKT